MSIQVWDYRREYERHRDEILAAVDRVFRSGRLILGESVRRFEEAFAAYAGGGFGIGVNSGTDALFLALKALGVGPGDEVVTVANTAVPTVSAIVSAGAVPRFVDIDPATCLMDAALLDAAITPRTRVILPVHLYGQCVDMDAVMAVARARGVKVLEDCAQSAGATFRRRPAGSFGDVAAFSFYPTKVLGAYGDGGLVLVRDGDMAARLRRLRMYGMEGRYYAEEHGYNSRLDEVQAEILTVKLAHLDEWIERRRALAAVYDRALPALDLAIPVEAPGNRHTYYVYVVRHPERDRIIAALKERDILLNVSYPYPIHTMAAYHGFGGREGDLPVTERLAGEVFSLPMFPTLGDDEQGAVVRALGEVV